MRRHCSPQPRLHRTFASHGGIARPIEPADRHARRLGVVGHVELRLRKETLPAGSRNASAFGRGKPLIDLPDRALGSLPARSIPGRRGLAHKSIGAAVSHGIPTCYPGNEPANSIPSAGHSIPNPVRSNAAPSAQPGTADQAAPFRGAHRPDLRDAVHLHRGQSSLLSTLAGSQRVRSRADRGDPGGADVPARRDDPADHRLCRSGQGPRRRPAVAGCSVGGGLLRLLPADRLWRRAGRHACAVDRMDATRAAGGLPGAIGRETLRIELFSHAHLGLDRFPQRQFRRRRDPVVDQHASRAGDHDD